MVLACADVTTLLAAAMIAIAQIAATTLLVLTPFVGLWAALPVAVVVASAEVLPGPHDDNVLIPVVTAACLWILGGGS